MPIKSDPSNHAISSGPFTAYMPSTAHSNLCYPNVNPDPSDDCALSQKIIAETSDTVLFNLKNWTQHDYCLFVEGLVSVQHEKDNAMKCLAIREKFLPQFSLDEIQKCYSLLQNVALKETQSQISSQNPPFSYSHPHMNSISPDMSMEAEAKRMRMMSSPIPQCPSDLVVSHFSPMNFTNNVNDIRFAYGTPYSINPMRYSVVNSYGYVPADTGFFPAFSSAMEPHQINTMPRSNHNELYSSRGSDDFEPSNF